MQLRYLTGTNLEAEITGELAKLSYVSRINTQFSSYRNFVQVIYEGKTDSVVGQFSRQHNVPVHNQQGQHIRNCDGQLFLLNMSPQNIASLDEVLEKHYLTD